VTLLLALFILLWSEFDDIISKCVVSREQTAT
jgi:hypothetical protein